MSRFARRHAEIPLQSGTDLWRRFWSKVEKTNTCWLWTGATSAGYGQFKHAEMNATASVHRLAYLSLRGQIPAGQRVLHRCDVPNCVNPEHLFLGTQRDNMRDCSAKGRARGRFSGATVCGNGLHPLTGANVIRRPNGWRRCRACEAARRASRASGATSHSIEAR